MLRLFVFVCLTFCGLVASASAESELRQWADASGKFKIDGKFVEVKNGKVVLKKGDGKQLEIPLDKLSPADRKYVDGLKAAAEENPFVDGEGDNPFVDGGVALPAKGKKKGDIWMAPDFAKLRRVPGLGKKDKNVWKFVPTPVTSELAKVVKLPKMSLHESVSSSAMSVNGEWMGLLINDPFAGARMMLLNLKDGELIAKVEFPKPSGKEGNKHHPVVHAVSPDGKYVLTGQVSDHWDAVNAMKAALWTVAGDELKQSLEWLPFDTGAKDAWGQDKSNVKWGAFPDSKRLLLMANEFIVSWDLSTGSRRINRAWNRKLCD